MTAPAFFTFAKTCVSRLRHTVTSALAASAIALSAAPLTATQAAADSHAAATPFSVGMQRAVTQLLTGVTDNTCYPHKGGVIPLAFVGMPPNNVHFSPTERDSLNKRTRSVLQGFSFFWKVLNTSTFETIAAQTGLNPGDRNQLIKAVREIRGTPLVFILNATRPAKSVAKLKLELYARTADGVQVCPKSETLFVDILKNTIVPDARVIELETDRPVVKRRWAFKHALREVAEDIRNFDTLGLEIDYRMSGDCRLRNTSEVAFRSDYTDIEREMLEKFALRTGDWPTLNIKSVDGATLKSTNATIADDAEKKSGTLRLEFTPDPQDPSLLDLALQVNAQSRNLRTRFMRVHIRPRLLRGCGKLSNNILERLVRETRNTEAAFSLRTSKQHFIVNQDEISVRIEPKADRYFYCWVMDSKGTAYVLLPLSKSQGLNPWKAGETRRYPDDFRDTALDQHISQPVVYRQAARELFGCFATPTRLKQELEARWLDLHLHNEGGGGPAGEIPSDAVSDWITTMRGVPGVEERYTWISAVER
ncbi:MAG: DUF4384 domain-containing protein [Pseudomonadota bacterium]